MNSSILFFYQNIFRCCFFYSLLYASKQLNQQSAKGATTKDFSFLTEVSPIYVTSLTGNHVSGTTTLTTSNLSSSNFNNSQSATASTATNSFGSQSNIGLAATSNPNCIQSIVHVHQPPAIHHINKIPAPLAGGWLIGESAQGHLITTNEQQVFQNILNNNNQTHSNNLKGLNSGNSAGGTVLYSGNCISSASESNITPLGVNNSNLTTTTKYGNLVTTPTTTTTGSNICELLANGHGPKKEVRHLHRSPKSIYIFQIQIILNNLCIFFFNLDSIG